jgi:hypothetical protein
MIFGEKNTFTLYSLQYHKKPHLISLVYLESTFKCIKVSGGGLIKNGHSIFVKPSIIILFFKKIKTKCEVITLYAGLSMWARALIYFSNALAHVL